MTATDDLCVNAIRVLSIDAVELAASGHPGMPMGAAPMAVLPSTVRARVSVEAGSPFGWERYVGPAGAIMGVDPRRHPDPR